MFLHLGSDTIIPLREVIAMVDMKAARAPVNAPFLDFAASRGRVTDVTDGPAKTVVLTDRGVFLSAISSLTLKKRANKLIIAEDTDE